MAKLAIKSDNRKQNLLLPPSLEELVAENHMVRIVDVVIERLGISDILSTYRDGGNSAFNPKIVLKVLVFAYLSNVYSSRRIEELLHRDICFMRLAGMGGNHRGRGRRKSEADKRKDSAAKLTKDETKSIRQIENDSIPRMEKYREQLAEMGDRNPYSKTDSDATFMRMKEDALPIHSP